MIKWNSKELLDEVRHELFQEHNVSITDTEILEVVRAFFGSIRKVMSIMNPMSSLFNGGSIYVPGLGKFKYNVEAKKRFATKMIWKMNPKRSKGEEHVEVSNKLYSYGWKFFKWTLTNGYIFINEVTNEVRFLNTNIVNSTIAAKIELLNMIEKENSLVLNPTSDADRINDIKGIYKYHISGNFIKKYKSIHEICLELHIAELELYRKIVANDRPRGFKSLVGEFVFIRSDGFVGNRIFNNPLQDIKYNQLVSILDKSTEEVLYDKIGTILEASKFLKYLGKKGVIEPYYIYKKGIIENKIIYGYKWRREDSDKDDNLQEEGD